MRYCLDDMDRPLTFEDFIAHEGQPIIIRTADGTTHSLTLVSVTRSRFRGTTDVETPFSLMLHAAADATLGQGTYQVSWPDGQASLLVVPLGPAPDQKAMRYQIVFN